MALERKILEDCLQNRVDAAVVRLHELGSIDTKLDSSTGATALHIACGRASLELARRLIEESADVTLGDHKGCTGLHYLCFNVAQQAAGPEDGNEERERSSRVLRLLELLMSKGAVVDCREQETGCTPLFYACGAAPSNRIASRLCQVLVERYGANPRAMSKHGSTPISEVCRVGNRDLALWLLRTVDDTKSPSSRASDGEMSVRDSLRRALWLSCQHSDSTGMHDVVSLLLKRGVDIGLRDNTGDSLLHLACRHAAKQTAELLLTAGLSVELRGKDQHTPLCAALLAADSADIGQRHAAEQLALCLIDKWGANVDTIGSVINGVETPVLLIAVRMRLEEASRRMIAKGAVVNAKETREGITALFEACRQRLPELAVELIRAGADVNAAVRDDVTGAVRRTLEEACANGLDQVVREMLARGAIVEPPLLAHALGLGRLPWKPPIVLMLVTNAQGVIHLPTNAVSANTDAEIELIRLILTDKPDDVISRLDAGVDIDRYGITTAIHIAARQGHDVLLRRLLDRSHDNHPAIALDYLGRTPLHYACMYDLGSTAVLLLEYGSPLKVVQKVGFRSKEICCEVARNVVRRIVEQHTQHRTTARNMSGFTGRHRGPPRPSREPATIGEIWGTEKFTDEDFVPNCFSLWIDCEHPPDRTAIEHPGSWRRVCELCPTSEITVVGETSPFDGVQGLIGTCYLLGCLAVLANRNNTISELLLDYSVATGVYTVRFFLPSVNEDGGRWTFVVVDDWLPMDPEYSQPVYSRCRRRSQWYVSIIEKAYAKLKGCYEAIDTGSATSAMVDLTGGAVERWLLRGNSGTNAGISAVHEIGLGVFWERLLAYHRAGIPMLCVIDSVPGEGWQMNTEHGLLRGHAYGILDVVDVGVAMATHGPTSGPRLLRLGNPHGRGDWTGRWACGSSQWTEAVRNFIESTYGPIDTEGQLWIQYEDFIDPVNGYTTVEAFISPEQLRPTTPALLVTACPSLRDITATAKPLRRANQNPSWEWTELDLSSNPAFAVYVYGVATSTTAGRITLHAEIRHQRKVPQSECETVVLLCRWPERMILRESISAGTQQGQGLIPSRTVIRGDLRTADVIARAGPTQEALAALSSVVWGSSEDRAMPYVLLPSAVLQTTATTCVCTFSISVVGPADIFVGVEEAVVVGYNDKNMTEHNGESINSGADDTANETTNERALVSIADDHVLPKVTAGSSVVTELRDQVEILRRVTAQQKIQLSQQRSEMQWQRAEIERLNKIVDTKLAQLTRPSSPKPWRIRQGEEPVLPSVRPRCRSSELIGQSAVLGATVKYLLKALDGVSLTSGPLSHCNNFQDTRPPEFVRTKRVAEFRGLRNSGVVRNRAFPGKRPAMTNHTHEETSSQSDHAQPSAPSAQLNHVKLELPPLPAPSKPSIPR